MHVQRSTLDGWMTPWIREAAKKVAGRDLTAVGDAGRAGVEALAKELGLRTSDAAVLVADAIFTARGAEAPELRRMLGLAAKLPPGAYAPRSAAAEGATLLAQGRLASDTARKVLPGDFVADRAKTAQAEGVLRGFAAKCGYSHRVGVFEVRAPDPKGPWDARTLDAPPKTKRLARVEGHFEDVLAFALCHPDFFGLGAQHFGAIVPVGADAAQLAPPAPQLRADGVPVYAHGPDPQWTLEVGYHDANKRRVVLEVHTFPTEGDLDAFQSVWPAHLPKSRGARLHRDQQLHCAETDAPTALLRAQVSVADTLERNDFTTHRGTQDYQRMHPELAADVPSWGAQTRVLDAGAGLALFFRELLSARKATAAPLPQLVAVAAKEATVTRAHAGVKVAAHDELTYREGLLGTDGALEAALGRGTFDRVLCSFGASHYGALDAVLTSYGELLRPGGRAYVHLDAARSHLTIEDRDGQPLDVLTYLSRARGLKVRATTAEVPVGRPEDPALLKHTAVVLERTAGAVSLPRLELVEMTASEPPLRRYRVVDGRAAPP